MTTQDSQSELDELRRIYKCIWFDFSDGVNREDMWLKEFNKYLEAYVTTRVKEAERLARIDELSALDKSEISNQSMKKMQIRIKGRIEALTTTTNGKGEVAHHGCFS